jgi:anti-sigma B factor antagonist
MHDTSTWAGRKGLFHRPRIAGDLQTLSLQVFEIDVERKPDRPVVAHVIGPVDLLTAPALRLCVDDNVDDDRGLVLDLSRVDFLAASGLTVLTDTKERATRENLAWALVANSRPVTRPLDLLGLRTQLPTYDSLPRAVAAVAGCA